MRILRTIQHRLLYWGVIRQELQFGLAQVSLLKEGLFYFKGRVDILY